MTFEELLDQVLAMLHCRGRVSYRTLTRQFALDEVDLEDLKEAIIYGWFTEGFDTADLSGGQGITCGVAAITAARVPVT